MKKTIAIILILFSIGIIYCQNNLNDLYTLRSVEVYTRDLEDGYFGFDYSGSSMNGSFYVSGIPDTIELPTEGVGGYHTSMNDSVYAVFTGIEAISEDSINIGLVYLHQPGELSTGVYNVDPFNLTALFGFGIGVNGMIDLDTLSFPDQIEADKIYVSATGTISIDEITETDILGTFTGLMVDVDNPMDMVYVFNGEFLVFNSEVLSVDPMDADSPIPSTFALHQNYPNPFNPRTIIEYDLNISEDVQLTIYDMNGRELDIIVDGYQSKGRYAVEWIGDDYSSGIYFYTLAQNGRVEMRKMLLIK